MYFSLFIIKMLFTLSTEAGGPPTFAASCQAWQWQYQLIKGTLEQSIHFMRCDLPPFLSSLLVISPVMLHGSHWRYQCIGACFPLELWNAMNTLDIQMYQWWNFTQLMNNEKAVSLKANSSIRATKGEFGAQKIEIKQPTINFIGAASVRVVRIYSNS